MAHRAGERYCPKYLFSEELEAIFNRAIDSRLITIFLDYDGTLSPVPRRKIRLERPLSDSARAIIHELSRHKKVKIFIISGRSIEALRKFIGIDDLYYIGIHGHVIRGPDMIYIHSALEELISVVKRVKNELSGLLSDIEGLVIEDKGAAISIHYRGIGRSRSKEIYEKVSRICSKYYGIVFFRGRSSIEIIPNTGWNKGRAIEYVLATLSMRTGLSASDIMPIYFGDDKSDETGFKLLREKGICVKVGYKCGTKAKYYVNNTEEVIMFLSGLKSKIL